MAAAVAANGYIRQMLEELAACAGSWRGASRLRLDPEAGTITTIAPVGDVLRIVMNNIWPEGREDLAVDASYTRV